MYQIVPLATETDCRHVLPAACDARLFLKTGTYGFELGRVLMLESQLIQVNVTGVMEHTLDAIVL